MRGGRSSLGRALAAARDSLDEPSFADEAGASGAPRKGTLRPSLAETARPFTPREDSRHMFYGEDYSSAERPSSRPSSTTWGALDKNSASSSSSRRGGSGGASKGDDADGAGTMVSDLRGHDHEGADKHASPAESWGWAVEAEAEAEAGKPAPPPSSRRRGGGEAPRRSGLRRSNSSTQEKIGSDIDAASDEVREATRALSEAWATCGGDGGELSERKGLLERCDLLWSAVDGLCSCATVRQRTAALQASVALAMGRARDDDADADADNGGGAAAAPSVTSRAAVLSLSQQTLGVVMETVPRLLIECGDTVHDAFGIRLTMKLVRVALRLACGADRETLVLFRLAVAGLEEPTHAPAALQRLVDAVDAGAAATLLAAVVTCCKRLYAASKEELGDSVACEELLPHALLDLLRVASRGSRTGRSSSSRRSRGGGRSASPSFLSPSHLPPTEWALPFDAVMYCAASLKNISSSAKVQRQLIDHRAIRKLTELLSTRAAPEGSERRGSAAAPQLAATLMSSRQVAQILVQVTATLRALGKCRRNKNDKRALDNFRAAGTATALLALVEPFVQHAELMYNVSRVVALVSLDPGCRKPLVADLAPCRALLRVLSVHYSSHRALTVRVCYILGNLVAAHASARKVVGIELDGVHVLGEIMARYMGELERLRATTQRRRTVGSVRAAAKVEERSSSSSSKLGDEEDLPLSAVAAGARAAMTRRSESQEQKRGQTRDELEDVLVKSVRVVANIALDHDVGWGMASSAVASHIVSLFFSMDVERAASEELCLNVVSTLANFSFYNGRGENSDSTAASVLSSSALNATTDSIVEGEEDEMVDYVAESRCGIVRRLVPLMLHPNEDMKVESLRALGNFSRSADTRRTLVADDKRGAGGDQVAVTNIWPIEVLAILLDHQRREIVFTACGVFTNLLADVDVRREALWRPIDGGCVASRLVAVVWDAGLDDVEMATIACRALANGMLGGNGNAAAASSKLGEDDADADADAEAAEDCGAEESVDVLSAMEQQLRRLGEAAADELDDLRLDADGLTQDDAVMQELAELNGLSEVLDKVLGAASQHLVAARRRARSHLVPL